VTTLGRKIESQASQVLALKQDIADGHRGLAAELQANSQLTRHGFDALSEKSDLILRAISVTRLERDSDALNAQFEAERLRFEAERLRFERWNCSVGPDGGQLSAGHQTSSVVENLLSGINNILETRFGMVVQQVHDLVPPDRAASTRSTRDNRSLEALRGTDSQSNVPGPGTELEHGSLAEFCRTLIELRQALAETQGEYGVPVTRLKLMKAGSRHAPGDSQLAPGAAFSQRALR
jgi:hypothetical protein